MYCKIRVYIIKGLGKIKTFPMHKLNLAFSLYFCNAYIGVLYCVGLNEYCRYSIFIYFICVFICLHCFQEVGSMVWSHSRQIRHHVVWKRSKLLERSKPLSKSRSKYFLPVVLCLISPKVFKCILICIWIGKSWMWNRQHSSKCNRTK